MNVVKRDNRTEAVSFDKVTNRINKLCYGLDTNTINPTAIAQKICARIYDGVKTTELDELTGQICSSLATDHPDYGVLASRIVISNHHKNTEDTFTSCINTLYSHDPPLVSKEIYDIVMNRGNELDEEIDYNRDYLIDYFGFKTLERSYLLKAGDKIVERPQHTFMRVALGIHLDDNDLKDAIQTYHYMSKKYFIHATPTLFNAGTQRPQLASCFLQATKDDSIDGIFDTLKSCANISKYSGGVGLHIHNVRGSGSYIKGTNGKSSGIIPMLGVFNKTAMYVDQCFRGDTHVYTDSKATKIEHIKAGDNVLTSDGTYHKVMKNVRSSVTKPLFRLRTNNAIDTVYVTGEHQIYAITKPPSIPLTEMPNYLNNNPDHKADFVSCNTLTSFDYIGYPIPDINGDSSGDTVTGVVDEDIYTSHHSKMSGIVFGNGTVVGDTASVKFYKQKGIDARNFLKEYLSDNNTEYSEKTERNTTIISWDFSQDEDVMPIKNPIKLNETNTKKFIMGILEANGCAVSSNYKCMFYNTTNKQIGYILRYLFIKIGILVDGFYRDKYEHYVICIPYTKTLFEMFNFTEMTPKDDTLTYFEYDGILWTGIKSIDEMKEFTGYVYDLQVADNHNYTTEMGLVHNSGKRNGNFAIYLEPSHPDILDFIDIRKNQGNESERCRELFTALWIPDLFMERIKNDEVWSLFCPNKCPLLSETYGDEYKQIYTQYEKEGKYVKQVKAQDLWKNILVSCKETGTPYICFKDTINRCSNQKNIGTIKSSNLCVAGDTLVTTDNGMFPIKDLCDKKLDVWNGFEYSPVTIQKTGTDQDLLNIKLSNGETLRTTPYHKFFLKKDNEKVEAKDLKVGDKLMDCKYPTIYRTGFATSEAYNKLMINRIAYIEQLTVVSLEAKRVINSMGIDVQIWEKEDKLAMSRSDFEKLREMGYRGINDKIYAEDGVMPDITVVSIEDGGKEDTYCFTDKLRGSAMFNNIYTGNCAEINLYSDKDETAVCNLASIALPMYISDKESHGHRFNFEKLREISEILCSNINKVIDRTFYPTPETEKSNTLRRPMGIGVQGLGNLYTSLGYPFESEEAKDLNRKIFETIYYGSVKRSVELAKINGTYTGFEGSPLSQGKFHFDLCEKEVSNDLWDWTSLRKEVMEHGVRNSQFIALMPTASTASILGNTECFEIITTNIYTRKTLAGEFVICNQDLVNTLMKDGLWNKEMKNKIIQNDGSVQGIKEIPENTQKIFKTAYEVHPRHVIDQCADRQAFVDQAQSMNIFVEDPTIDRVSNILFYGWKNNLKTGLYYLRTKLKAKANQFSIDPTQTCESCSA
tara:strand:+ start:1066 stop:5025 length:3960 start_codon:yes stop_codon:yes gene_type:complete